MKKPVLVIMAAGMGSRYGGLKQIDKIDSEGHIIMDFSIYDAKLAGFEKVVFIIKRENLELFREVIGDSIAAQMEVSFCFQELSNLPEGFEVPKGRVKPWGTAHAVLSCLGEVGGPFAVINADDYYGRESFRLIYDYLSTHEDNEKYQYAMVGYEVGKTVTEHGSVSRGVCELNEAGELLSVTERTRIEKLQQGIAYTLDEGKSWIPLDKKTAVSMNMWGFTNSILKEIESGFVEFLKNSLKENPLKGEYYLPSIVSQLLEEGKATVTVLRTAEEWHGVTYQEDKPLVVEAIRRLKEEGKYPKRLWK